MSNFTTYSQYHFYCLLFHLILYFSCYALLYLFPKISNKKEFLLLIVTTSWAFSFLGLTLGLFTGLSRDPISGVLVSSFLTLVGSVLGYFFIKESTSLESKATITTIIVSTSFMLLIGSQIGSEKRIEYELNREEGIRIYNEQIRELEHYYAKDLEEFKAKLIVKKDNISESN